MRLFEGTEWDQPPKCDRCGRLEDDCDCPPPPKVFAAPENQTARLSRRFAADRECIDYCNNHHSHTERDWLPPIREEPDEVDSLKLDQVEVKSHVGGLVKSFERKAA